MERPRSGSLRRGSGRRSYTVTAKPRRQRQRQQRSRKAGSDDIHCLRTHGVHRVARNASSAIRRSGTRPGSCCREARVPPQNIGCTPVADHPSFRKPVEYPTASVIARLSASRVGRRGPQDPRRHQGHFRAMRFEQLFEKSGQGDRLLSQTVQTARAKIASEAANGAADRMD